VSRLSKQCGILNILRPYSPPRLVTEIAFSVYYYYYYYYYYYLVVKALGYKPEGGQVRDPIRRNFKMYLIIPAALGPGVYSVYNRNEYRKHKRNVSWE
jgi:hypothetical protein